MTLRGAGAAVAPADWLSYGVAADLPFDAMPATDAVDLVYEAVEDAPIDAVAQPVQGRRKRLLVISPARCASASRCSPGSRRQRSRGHPPRSASCPGPTP
jgi:hypothetical protein